MVLSCSNTEGREVKLRRNGTEVCEIFVQFVRLGFVRVRLNSGMY